MNFDNIDGNQARKTGNSSPLGILFDHGCDALNMTIITMNFGLIAMYSPCMLTQCCILL